MQKQELAAGPAGAAEGMDELLACLMMIARAHGESPTRDALLAGLPLEQHRLTPSLFERAARRAHLSSRLVRVALTDLKQALLPAIILLNNDRACVLLGYNDNGSGLRVCYPELGDAPVDVSLDSLAADYLGMAIYARPIQRYDARTPEVRHGRHGHWFWSVPPPDAKAVLRRLHRGVTWVVTASIPRNSR